jgi:hypothetical protein
MVLCEDTYKCTWKDVDAMLAQLLGARRGYEDVISNARHRSKDVGMVLVGSDSVGLSPTAEVVSAFQASGEMRSERLLKLYCSPF